MKGMRARLAASRAEAQAGAARGETQRRPPPVWPMRLAALALVAVLGGVAVWLSPAPREPPPAEPAPGGGAAVSSPASAPAPAAATGLEAPDRDGPLRRPPLRDMEAIIAAPPAGLGVSRLAALPRVLVLDFPSLAAQGAALNRVAALIEKADYPRGRVVSQERLAEGVRRRGGSLDTFYYGHNYDSGELARFFRLVEESADGLSPAEAALRVLLVETGTLSPGPGGVAPGRAIVYVISLARIESEGAGALRRAILRHEIGHAVYARRPAYRDRVAAFWEAEMSAAEREAFRAFLARTGYDITDRALVLDEMQAYLHFTPDPGMMSDEVLGLGDGTLAALRRRFAEGLDGLDLPAP